jgi:hypothetical protein
MVDLIGRQPFERLCPRDQPMLPPSQPVEIVFRHATTMTVGCDDLATGGLWAASRTWCG